jgi:hypothetical protein
VKQSRSGIDVGCGIAEATKTMVPRAPAWFVALPGTCGIGTRGGCRASPDRRPGRGSTARLQPRHEKEFLQVSNEETPTTEQPRAQALAMRAVGKKKAAKKAGRKAAPKKKAAAKKGGARKKAAGRKKTAAKKGGRKAAAKKKSAAKKGGRKKAAARKKGGGRKKAAAAAAPAPESMPSDDAEMG